MDHTENTTPLLQCGCCIHVCWQSRYLATGLYSCLFCGRCYSECWFGSSRFTVGGSHRDGCSNDEASREMDVADASVSEVRIFILLSLCIMQTNGHWRCRSECWFGSASFHCGRFPQSQLRKGTPEVSVRKVNYTDQVTTTCQRS
jgi:hypothetical protein